MFFIQFTIIFMLFVFSIECKDTALCNPKTLRENNVTQYELSGLVNCNCTNCIRKCCAYGFYLSKGICWKYNGTEDFQLKVYNRENYFRNVNGYSAFTVGVNDECSMEILIPDKDIEERFYIQEDGSLWIHKSRRLVTNEEYCIDNTKENGLISAVCESNAEKWAHIINKFGIILSIPFLLGIVIIYGCLPKRTTHMKVVMCYVTALSIAYIFILCDHFYEGNMSDVTCKILGYLRLTSLIASFHWMTILCLDIWINFRSLQGLLRSKKADSRFFCYCGYSISVTLLHMIIIASVDFLKDANDWYHPRIGIGTCWLRRGWPQFFYVYIPMTVIIITNTAFFISTATGIWKIKVSAKKFQENSSRKENYEDQRNLYHLFFKLLLTMGINWSLEIISFVVVWRMEYLPLSLWYATDFSNAAYGFVLFLIFVVKKRIWISLKERFSRTRGVSEQSLKMKATKKNCTITASEMYTKKENET